MIIVENTKENKAVQQAVASLAIEGMYCDKEFIYDMLKISTGEKTTEELIQETIEKYAGH